ncbi:MAG: thiamine pyrophosphate-dependent dehydrogenase E1 component subunit alpha [Ignavibacteriae bacterium]|nr:thiamine pyrophosphate-dependent dehydrogenase E1 component subunit alpha [Ignavibacteria bacterium]MBI3364243.1 thiamine pyrophosphate-dependent dehydrogenase E1 component subunit alpha [Ignavibacteriota bacterium]
MPSTTKSKHKKSSPAPKQTAFSSLNGVLKPDDYLKLYRFMLLMREFEETILKLYQQGKIVGGAYSGRGNEATAVGSTFALEKTDYLFPLHRDIGAHFVKGQTVRNMMLQHLGRAGSLTKGRDGTGHYADPKLRIYGNISHLGAMVPVACGVALASKLRKEKNVVMTYIGDGGASVGEVHEGLMMASTMRLPFVLIIENNQYAYSTPISKQFIVEKLSDRAIGYGIPGITVDGTDVLEVYRVCREAVERARKGEGPTIIESVTMRMAGHAAHDNAWYVPKLLLEQWKKKDPIGQFEKLLMDEGILTTQKKESMLAEMRSVLEAEAQYALEQPYPPGEQASEGVYAE